MNELPTITLAAPIQNRDFVLNQYLDHIYKIDYPKNRLELLFVLNNSSDHSEEILRIFKKKHNDEYKCITIDTYNRDVPQDTRKTSIRNEYIYQHLSILKNYIMFKVKTEKLMFIDSDILVPDSVINNLLKSKKNIVSGLIYNGYLVDPEQPYKYPNVMRLNEHNCYEHISNSYIRNAPQLKEQQLIKVDLTGAVFMLDKQVYKKIKFGYHPQGEDAYFCAMAQRNGFEIWCDVGTFCTHVMEK
ncbi:Anp1 protein [Paenibacillus sophorae]|uniref:Anp1 protein n=1 Tax=Paenibacillus sophorae TaxID=1333845 RepID=A0A1H8H4I0_9BACL|nr:glycosyltransferase family 2 protein [Paenibacillus sophorae]QWU14439.1 glycosyltransferase family 2 protein [Paenibacillus sophorae]SEN51035.1 Anp1 protein [Paenibacillus sophorae]